MTQEQLYDIYRSNGIVKTERTVGHKMYIRGGAVTFGCPLYRGAPKGLRRALRNKYHWLHAA